MANNLDTRAAARAWRAVVRIEHRDVFQDYERLGLNRPNANDQVAQPGFVGKSYKPELTIPESRLQLQSGSVTLTDHMSIPLNYLPNKREWIALLDARKATYSNAPREETIHIMLVLASRYGNALDTVIFSPIDNLGELERVEFTVRRPGAAAPFQVPVTLGSSFAPNMHWEFSFPELPAPAKFLGLERWGLQTLGWTAKPWLGFGAENGLIVVAVQPDSAAARSGIREGDVIESIDGHVVAPGGTRPRQHDHCRSHVEAADLGASRESARCRLVPFAGRTAQNLAVSDGRDARDVQCADEHYDERAVLGVEQADDAFVAAEQPPDREFL